MLLAVSLTASVEVRAQSVELAAADRLIEALERENAALRDRLETEKQATAVLTELNDARRREAEALRTALAAKNETIAAKDAAINAQETLIEDLRRKRVSIWKRIGDVAIGIAAGALLR